MKSTKNTAIPFIVCSFGLTSSAVVHASENSESVQINGMQCEYQEVTSGDFWNARFDCKVGDSISKDAQDPVQQVCQLSGSNEGFNFLQYDFNEQASGVVRMYGEPVQIEVPLESSADFKGRADAMLSLLCKGFKELEEATWTLPIDTVYIPKSFSFSKSVECKLSKTLDGKGDYRALYLKCGLAGKDFGSCSIGYVPREENGWKFSVQAESKEWLENLVWPAHESYRDKMLEQENLEIFLAKAEEFMVHDIDNQDTPCVDLLGIQKNN